MPEALTARLMCTSACDREVRATGGRSVDAFAVEGPTRAAPRPNEVDSWTSELSGDCSRAEVAGFLTDGPIGGIWDHSGREIVVEPYGIARALHDSVIQRLCGVSLLLKSPWEHDAAEAGYQDMCGREVAKALAELRTIIDASLACGVSAVDTCAIDELVELVDTCSPLVRQRVIGIVPKLPPAVRRVLDHTLAETFRNIAKHARPKVVEIDLSFVDDVLELVVSNDGVNPSNGPGLGVGSRLLTMDAASCGGSLISAGDGRAWTTRLTVPTAA